MSCLKLLFAVTACLATVEVATAQPFPVPQTSLSCGGFTKNSDGTWHASSSTAPFDMGSAKGVVIRNTTVTQSGVSVGGFDLYTALEKRCGGG